METVEELKQELERQRARALDERRQREEAEARALDEQRQREKAEARALQRVNEAEARAFGERRQREEAEARALDEQRQREKAEARALQRVNEAEARALDEQRQREKAEQAVAPTDYDTFLSLCHHNLHSTLTIQEDPALTAAGTFTNVDSKYYPLHLKPWADFPSLHDRCQERLKTLFIDKNVFPSVDGFNTMNNILAMDEPLADENDVRLLQFVNVESCARRVLFQYLKESKGQPSRGENEGNHNEGNEESKDNENTTLPVRVYFSNAPHGILLDGTEGGDENQHSGTKPAYKPAMLAAQQKDAESRGRSAGDGPPPAKRKSSPVRRFHPDQWLMRVNDDGSIVPVFVVEYKAAHKLRGSTLKLALFNNTRKPQGLFTTVIHEQIQNKIVQDGSLKDQVNAEKATARVIAQAFHYMVEFGLCYSYVASGEALVLLHFDAADVRTLYYHLALPREEVGTGAEENVRRTAVSLVSTIALLALDEAVLSQRWKKHAESVLKQWPTPYDEMRLLDQSSEEEDGEKLKNVPQLPPHTGQQSCTEETTPQRRRRKDDDGDREFLAPKFLPASVVSAGRQYGTRSKGTGGGNNSNNTARQHKPLPYCSQACILGLRNGGPLDHGCPNVRFHLHRASNEDDRHGLTAIQFRHEMQQQLEDDLDENCDALDRYGKFGAIGMLFRLTLQDYGYCVVAKGVQRAHAPRLQQEVAVYSHLQAQQGTLVPVCLGMIDLVQDYKTSFGARIFHMMLMAYGGEQIFSKAAGPMPDNISTLMWNAWVQLRQLGVEHGDEREPNLLWNASLQRPMCIDFEYAKVVINRKQKHGRETLPSPVPPKRQRLGDTDERMAGVLAT